MKHWIGIDPGLSGAIAIIDEGGGLTIVDTPAVVVKKPGRRDYLTSNMALLLRGCSDAAAALEMGIPMPSQASNTTYLMGRGGGLWEGILAAYGIPYDLVRPQAWKKALGIAPGSDKGASRMLAQRLFPAYADLFARVKDDGRAEAALLAEHRKRIG